MVDIIEKVGSLQTGDVTVPKVIVAYDTLQAYIYNTLTLKDKKLVDGPTSKNFGDPDACTR